MKFVILIAVLIFASADTLTIVEVEPTAAEASDEILDWQHPFRYTTPHKDLLLGVESEHPHPSDQVKQKKIIEIKDKIKDLVFQLSKEEKTFIMLKDSVSAAKTGFFWFFNSTSRRLVDAAQLQVNDQKRVIDNILDDVSIQWKRLKPLYGIYSKLFLTESMSFIPEIWNVSLDVFTTLLELGLLSLVLFGSITGFALSLFASTGFAFFPAILCFATLAVNTYWLCKLPFIMIEYDPALTDFLAVYFSFAGVLLGITYFTFKLLFPETVRVKIMTR